MRSPPEYKIWNNGVPLVQSKSFPTLGGNWKKCSPMRGTGKKNLIIFRGITYPTLLTTQVCIPLILLSKKSVDMVVSSYCKITYSTYAGTHFFLLQRNMQQVPIGRATLEGKPAASALSLPFLCRPSTIADD